MKRIACLILTAAITLLFSFACAEEYEIHNTEHFVYAAPKNWHKQVSASAVSHYGKTIGSPAGGFISSIEQTNELILSYADDLDTFYNAVINSAVSMNGSNWIIKNIEIDGRPARVVLGALDTESAVYDAAYIFLLADKYMFCQAIIDTEQTAESLFQIAEDLSRFVHFSEDVENPDDSLLDPRDYSGSVLQKVYAAYDYSTAKNTPEAYKGTSVYASGWVFMYKILDDGWGYALIFESESGKPVYITLPPGSVPVEGVDIGDNIEVYGVSQTLTETTPAYPIILTTMKIVNHGPRE